MSLAVFCPSCAQDTIPIRGVCPWCDTILRGSQAGQQISLETAENGTHADSRITIIEAMTTWHAQHGAWPQWTDWPRATSESPSRSAVTRLFGSWKVAIRQAQLALGVEEAVAA